MREIKLQFWNRESKTMSVPYTLADLAYEGFPNQYKNEYDDVLDKKCDVLQYTGLKDKNGKEIYEGDILHGSWYVTSDKREKNHIVKWENYGWDFGEFPSFVEIEIIGNIYENPELLNPHTT